LETQVDGLKGGARKGGSETCFFSVAHSLQIGSWPLLPVEGTVRSDRVRLQLEAQHRMAGGMTPSLHVSSRHQMPRSVVCCVQWYWLLVSKQGGQNTDEATGLERPA
jgi:hypothetical protein